jgi:DNA-damage-inducible protein D
MDDDSNRIAMFRQKEIRRRLHSDEWWFVIVDVVAALTDSVDPSQYIKRMRQRDGALNELFQKGGVHIVPPLGLSFQTAGGSQKLMCWNTEALLRLVQSIPSPKAEPFKLWLAKAGYERVKEIEDPERAAKRTRELYKAKGYPDDWIERRMRGIAIREELTEEWNKRGLQGSEYGILTNEIAKATFGVTPAEHKAVKGLKRQNLRDHMTDLEQIFSMLGEASTTEITRSEDAKGFNAARSVARRGGDVAGKARKQLEKETGKSVISGSNYLDLSAERKQQKLQQ